MTFFRSLEPRKATLTSHKLLALASIGVLFIGSAKAATVVSGELSLNYDQTALATNLGLVGINEFNQATSNSSTRSYIVSTSNSGDTTGSWTNLPFDVNGSSLSNPTGRTLQATNLSYNPANFASTITGQIGLGGVSRFDVSPFVGGGIFVLGDYSLQYNASRAGVNLGGGETGSGWYLQNHFDFNVNAFDLANLTTSSVTSDGINLAGDLVASSSSALLLFGASAGNYGSFSFTAQAVPEPSRALLLMLGGMMIAGRRKRTAC